MEPKMEQGIKTNNKTKVMAISDIHGDTSFVKKLAEKAKKENVDVIILAGDITFFEIETKNLIGPLLESKKPILLLPGNHESPSTTSFLANKYNINHLHGNYFIHNNVAFFGAGGATSGPFFTPESEIYNLLKKSNDTINSQKFKNQITKKVMITHMHASGTIIEKIANFAPSSEVIRKAIENFKPDIAISGHIHESAGLEDKIGKTRVISVARKEVIFEI